MEFSSEGIFEKYFGFKIFEKGQILMPFSGLAPSTLKIVPNKIKGRLCVRLISFSIWVMESPIG